MGIVSYECVMTTYCSGEANVPDEVIANGNEAIEEWLNDNELDNVKDYGDCDDVEWEFSVEDDNE